MFTTMFSRCHLLLACLLCGVVLTSLLSLQLQTADVMLPTFGTGGVNDTRVIEEDGSRQDALVIWAASLENGELATGNMTLTRDIRRRIDASFIVSLNPAGGAGRSFSRRCKELFNSSYKTRAHRRTPRIMHIPKTQERHSRSFSKVPSRATTQTSLNARLAISSRSFVTPSIGPFPCTISGRAASTSKVTGNARPGCA